MVITPKPFGVNKSVGLQSFYPWREMFQDNHFKKFR